LHIDEVAQEIRRVIASDIDIFNKIRVVEGYTFWTGINTPKEDISSKIGILIEAFGDIDVDSCDSAAATNILKLGFAIGKTLSTTVPAKLDAAAWKQGAGKELTDWFRRAVATFSRRFGDDFEIMEVIFWSIVTYEQVITEILQFSISNRGGLLEFSPSEITELIIIHFSRADAIESNSSTLIVGLAISLTRAHSGRHSSEITPQIEAIIGQLTNSLLPSVTLPGTDVFSPEILLQPIVAPLYSIVRSNPELLYQYFEFLSKTMTRYSLTWKQNLVQRWMLCVLVSLGNPEGGMSFQGAVDFLVLLFIE
jgi:hypothetical protein